MHTDKEDYEKESDTIDKLLTIISMLIILYPKLCYGYNKKDYQKQ